MTLKEKFRGKILSFLSDNMKEQNAIECEKIADNFAIGFANWYFEKLTVADASEWFGFSDKDMLNAYKTEKGL